MIEHRICKTAFGVLVALLAVATLPARTALGSIEKIVNGSFENIPVSGLTDKFAVLLPGSLDLPSWIIHPYPNANSTTGIDLLYSNGASDTNPYVIGTPADGLQFIDLAGSPGPGQISQTFATCIGVEYTLSFSYANNYDGWQNGPATPGQPTPPGNVNGISALVEVIGASVFSQAISHTSSYKNNLNWTPYTTTFIADSLSTTLRFTSTGTNDDQQYGLLLDKVSVTGDDCSTVPEPMTVVIWSLLLGVAGIFAVRHQNRSDGTL